MENLTRSLWAEPLSRALRRSVGRALGDFSMIGGGDRVLLGLSGGKDSLVLLHALSEFRRRSPVRFDLEACTVVMDETEKAEMKPLEDYCHAREVPWTVLRHPILEIIRTRNERSPCSFCANMRRGLLSSHAAAGGFNSLALGHSLDDAVETFFMNLLRAGRARSFQPNFYQDRTGIRIIRPLTLTRESGIIAEVRRLALPVLASACPYAGKTERSRTKEILAGMSRDHPDLFGNVLNALKNLDSKERWAAKTASVPETEESQPTPGRNVCLPKGPSAGSLPGRR